MLVDRRQFIRLSACGIAYPFPFNNKVFYQMTKSPDMDPSGINNTDAIESENFLFAHEKVW